jgi:hypothetical protein
VEAGCVRRHAGLQNGGLCAEMTKERERERERERESSSSEILLCQRGIGLRFIYRTHLLWMAVRVIRFPDSYCYIAAWVCGSDRLYNCVLCLQCCVGKLTTDWQG